MHLILCVSLSLATEPAAGPPPEPLALGPFASHAGAVHALQIYGGRLYSCSGDFTAQAYCLVVRSPHGPLWDGLYRHSNTQMAGAPRVERLALRPGPEPQ